MSSYADFVGNGFMGAIKYETKLSGYILSRDEYRVKDYILSFFDSENPIEYLKVFKDDILSEEENSEDMNVIVEGIRFLKDAGWHAKLATWKEIGKQFILISPKEEYYHSHYKW